MSGNKYKKSATELEEYQKTEDWKDDALEYLLAPLSREEIVRACSLTPKSTNPHKPTLISTVSFQIIFILFNNINGVNLILIVMIRWNYSNLLNKLSFKYLIGNIS